MSAERPWERPAGELPGGARTRLLGLDRAALEAFMAGLGEPSWRGRQLYEGLYRHRWAGWDRFTALGKDLRTRLEACTDLSRPLITESAPSGDGSTKHALRLADGQLIEGVHMPYAVRRAAAPVDRRKSPQKSSELIDYQENETLPLDRITLCLSSQVGCAMGCTFCATGQMGILRNLSAGEILGQVAAMLDHHGHPEGRPVNLVFMGMGEPLHNLENLMAAFRILTDPAAFGIPPRRITVSTSGLVSGIERLASWHPRPRLALSLNATTDADRSRIMPVNRVWGLAALREALRAFPLERQERITLEYVLLKDVTDTAADGERLADFARAFPSKVNLIPFNDHEGSGFQAPDESRIDALCAQLVRAGVPVSVRRSRGQDVAGACGQLVRGRRDGPRPG